MYGNKTEDIIEDPVLQLTRRDGLPTLLDLRTVNSTVLTKGQVLSARDSLQEEYVTYGLLADAHKAAKRCQVTKSKPSVAVN